MRRVKRLKEAIARLERETGATEAQLNEEFEHGYAAGFNAGRADMDKKLRDLVMDISLAAAFTGKDLAELPAHVSGLYDTACTADLGYDLLKRTVSELREEIARLKGEQ